MKYIKMIMDILILCIPVLGYGKYLVIVKALEEAVDYLDTNVDEDNQEIFDDIIDTGSETLGAFFNKNIDTGVDFYKGSNGG